MTGYGRGEQSGGGFRVEVELKAVNRKQAELQINLPRELDALEAQVRDRVNAVVSRGRVEVRVRLTQPASATTARFNSAVALAYVNE